MSPNSPIKFSDDETVTTAWKDEGLVVVNTFQDVEDIIEHNKQLRRDPQRSDWGRHIATIPNNILNGWLQEEWARGNINMKFLDAEMNKLIDRKLKDPEWAYLRTDK